MEYLLMVSIIYFLPSIIAFLRSGKKNKGPVVIVNLFLGWTFLGWIIALAMAFGS